MNRYQRHAFDPWSLLSRDVVNTLLSTAVCKCSVLFNCISCPDLVFFLTICNSWTIKDVVWCRCSTEQSNYCCKTQVLAVSINLCFLHSNAIFNDICEKLFNSLPLWMLNNLITKRLVIELKTKTLILISCQEAVCDCVSYMPLMKNSFPPIVMALILTIVRAENYQRTYSIIHNSSSSPSVLKNSGFLPKTSIQRLYFSEQ